MTILDKILGDPSQKYLRRIQHLVEKINSLESGFEKLSSEELREKTLALKRLLPTHRPLSHPPTLKRNKALDDILPEAFALVREAAKRTLGQRHFDVQLMGGVVLHEGRIAEMVTGEGKTLTATLPLYLNALEGKGCHLVTVNDYLAKRDTVWMGQIYHALGLSVGCIVHDNAYIYDPGYLIEQEAREVKSEKLKVKSYTNEEDKTRDTVGGFKVVESYLRPCSRKEAYSADITYGTNNEFGFDYLRDNMAYPVRNEISNGAYDLPVIQREHNFAIVDEVDSILIDEARTPLIISQPDVESSKMYGDFARIIPRLKENSDYNVDEKMKAVTLTEDGILRIEQILGLDNIYAEKGMKYLHYLEQALKAEILFKKDKDYIVKDDQIVIVDEFTGRLLPGRRYSEGLHQAIEAKEGVRVRPESLTLASITFQNYFRLYKKLAGMTGTAITSAEEFDKVYNLEVVSVPTNRPMIRQKLPDKVFKSEKGKFSAVVQEIKKRNQAGQSILVGTTSIEKNEYLGKLLEREGIQHHILNAKNHEKEGEIIAQAGKLRAVTVATNMAGRGVDIILGGNPSDSKEAEKVRQLGGLCVIGTERHEARRIDNQLRGRAGRQGDPGVSQFFVSLEDDLLRIFGGDRVKNLMERFNFPDDEPIEIGLVSKALEEAQSKIEGMNLDIRKHLLEYDEVLNKHREVIYKKRRNILKAQNLKTEILEIFKKEIQRITDFHCFHHSPADWNLKEIFEEIKAMAPVSDEVYRRLRDFLQTSDSAQLLKDKIFNYLFEFFQEFYQAKEKEVGEENMRQIEKIVLLRSLDFLWIDHLTMMDHLRDSVRLRAYGQQDPLVEYKSEGHRAFQQLLALFESNIAKTILKVSLAKETQMESETPRYTSLSTNQTSVSQPMHLSPNTSVRTQPATPKAKKIGRNAPCPCGKVNPLTGKPIKYKKCCYPKFG